MQAELWHFWYQEAESLVYCLVPWLGYSVFPGYSVWNSDVVDIQMSKAFSAGGFSRSHFGWQYQQSARKPEGVASCDGSSTLGEGGAIDEA